MTGITSISDDGKADHETMVGKSSSVVETGGKDQDPPTQDENETKPWFSWWLRFTGYIKQPILLALVFLARTCAGNPITTVVVSITFASAVAVTGLFTNLEIVVDANPLWTPLGSDTYYHWQWTASEEAGFPKEGRTTQTIIYKKDVAEGSTSNILTVGGALRLFDVMDTLQFETEPSFADEVCVQSTTGVCLINSPTGFWTNHSRAVFESTIRTDEDVAFAMSALTFADGEPVRRSTIFGDDLPELLRDEADLLADNNVEVSEILLESVTAFLISITLPGESDEVLAFERDLTQKLLDLRDKWDRDNPRNEYTLQVYTLGGVYDELNRGIADDIPLMAVAFNLMGIFCAVALFQFHPVKSQALLGVGAIGTIILSLMTGYGLMFCFGVWFTPLSQLFPYIMVGIGLDDTFILTGAFARTDPNASIEDRMEQIMREVGISVSVSTLTTVVAFLLGGITTLPIFRAFAWYAGVTVAVDFFYQVTFFMALLSLDSRRQKANRRDCCPCCKSKVGIAAAQDDDNEEQTPTLEQNEALDLTSDDNNTNSDISPAERETYLNRMVAAYANLLLHPFSKVLVLLSFSALLVLGAFGASRQEQQFDFRKLTPTDSYIRSFFSALDEYIGDQSESVMVSAMYFRDLDVSVESNRDAILQYVDDMVDLPTITFPPERFWLRDFNAFVNETTDEDLLSMTFEEQMDVFLSTSPYQERHQSDVVRNDKLEVTASRSYFKWDGVDAFDSQSQINALDSQKKVAEAQPLNQDQPPDDWNFFSYGNVYHGWALYSVVPSEIILTVAFGLFSVLLISLVFLPHPVGAIIVTPVVAAIYVELLACLYWAGLYINSSSALGLSMSIGLVVDYNMHIVLTYFEIKDAETRQDRVKKVLTTIGKSVMLGAFSTFLGVLPLAFSATEIFRTFFVIFIGIVFLGAGHGLVFTPVVLSLIAPHSPPKGSASGEVARVGEDPNADVVAKKKDKEVDADESSDGISDE